MKEKIEKSARTERQASIGTSETQQSLRAPSVVACTLPILELISRVYRLRPEFTTAELAPVWISAGSTNHYVRYRNPTSPWRGGEPPSRRGRRYEAPRH